MVICGVVIGFNVAGLLGAFLAAPVIASLRVIGGYIHAKLLDYPPFDGRIGVTPPGPRTYRRTLKGEEIRRMVLRKSTPALPPENELPQGTAVPQRTPTLEDSASTTVVAG